MTKKIALIAASVALLFAGAAQAQTGFRAPSGTSPLYGELGYTWMKFKVEGGPDFDTGFVRGIIGYDFHPGFAGELMVAGGTQKDTHFGTTVDPRSAVGIYLKPKANFGNIEVYGRLGWTQVRIRASDATGTESGKDNDFSYGLGANFAFAPRWYAGADWMRYTKKDGVTSEGPTLSVGYRF
jgi:hypothetical protein